MFGYIKALLLYLLTRKQPSFKGIGSAGGTQLQRLSTSSMWDYNCPLGGVRVSVSWCGSTTPATSPTSKTDEY